MQSRYRSQTVEPAQRSLTNKQVVAIYITGLALLLGAFWGGMSLLSHSGAPARTGSQSQSHRPAQNGSQSAAQPAPGENQYIVFVAAFGTLARAKQMESELHEQKYLAAHVKNPVGEDTLYRINIGPYSKTDADQVASELSQKGYRGVMILPWMPN